MWIASRDSNRSRSVSFPEFVVSYVKSVMQESDASVGDGSVFMRVEVRRRVHDLGCVGVSRMCYCDCDCDCVCVGVCQSALSLEVQQLYKLLAELKVRDAREGWAGVSGHVGAQLGV